jgi:transposase
VISVPAGVRILLAARPVDFRRGAHALAGLAAETLGEDPFSGTVLVFRAKRSDRVKILLWDASGLVLVCFVWPPVADGVVRLSAAQFAALFDGLDWPRLATARRIPTPSAAAWNRRHDARCRGPCDDTAGGSGSAACAAAGGTREMRRARRGA